MLGIDAAGRATVVWFGGGGTGEPSLFGAETGTDGRFGRPQRIVRSSEGSAAALAVAPDGRALLTTGGWEGPALWERARSGARFVAVPHVELPYASETAVALGPDGAALVALRQQPHYVVAWHRAAGARRFSAPQRLAGRPAFGVSFAEIDMLPSVGERPEPADGTFGLTLDARLDDRGRALLTWTRAPTRWRAAAAMAAASDAAGRFADVLPLGSRCRSAVAVRSLPLAAGGLGLAWTDVGRLREGSAESVLGYVRTPSAQDGRLNVVVPREPAAPHAAATSAASVPRVTARVVGRRALRIGAPLAVRVRCPQGGAPCAVRVVATARMTERRDGRPRPSAHEEQLSDTTTLAPGAATVLRFDPSPDMRIAPLGASRPAIALTSCAPSGDAAVRSTLRPRLTGLPRTPAPQLLDVRARRRGDAVRVTGRLSRPAPGAHLDVVAPGERHATVELDGRRTRFAVTLEGPVRVVQLLLGTQERWNADRLTVRVGAAARP